jgi:long-chain acyl-CoA synthetase
MTGIVKQGHSARIRPFDEKGIFRGEDDVLHYPECPSSILEMLRATVAGVPENEAIVEVGGERFDYATLWSRSSRVAGGLMTRGIKPGDRVAIHLGNGADWVVAFFGTLMAGAVVVPVNTRFSHSEVDYVVENSGAQFIFRSGAALPDGDATVIDGLRPGDLAAIFYTSGTTGFPKGAMTSHENLYSSCENTRRALFTDCPDIRNLISVPLFHVTGCQTQLLSTCLVGGTSVIMPAFDVGVFLETIGEERINTVTSVPAIFWLAIHQPQFEQLDMSGVRRISYGGAPTSRDQVLRLKEAFPNALLGNGYGLTETSSGASLLPHDYTADRPGSIGFALPVVEFDLYDADPVTGAGELVIKGPNVVSGYWMNPTATAEAFVDGWLHTGDIATLDDDGFCTIVDRKKDMINRGGEKVYSVEVENVLLSCPGVYEIAIVGVPDEMMGEKVGAVVVPKSENSLDGATLVEFATGRMADFKIPQYVSISMAPLPRNANGKVLKHELRDQTVWGEPLR